MSLQNTFPNKTKKKTQNSLTNITKNVCSIIINQAVIFQSYTQKSHIIPTYNLIYVMFMDELVQYSNFPTIYIHI